VELRLASQESLVAYPETKGGDRGRRKRRGVRIGFHSSLNGETVARKLMITVKGVKKVLPA